MSDKTVMYNLFLDGEKVGEGATLLTKDNKVIGAGGPLGYINMVCMAPFEGLFPGYVKTEDTGKTEPWGKEGEMAKVVNVYTFSEEKWYAYMKERNGGSQPTTLPF